MPSIIRCLVLVHTLQVYNRNFEETQRACTDDSYVVSHLLFNPELNEVITGGACVRVLQLNLFFNVISHGQVHVCCTLTFKSSEDFYIFTSHPIIH